MLEPFWQTYHELDTALSAFQKHLPRLDGDGRFDVTAITAHIRGPSRLATPSEFTDAWSRFYTEDTTFNTARHWHTFLFVQSCIYAGTIALHGMLANTIDNESTVVLNTAGKMAELVKLFAVDDDDTSGVLSTVKSSDRVAKNMYLFVAVRASDCHCTTNTSTLLTTYPAGLGLSVTCSATRT